MSLAFLPLRRRLFLGFDILNDIFRSLRHDVSYLVKAPPPGSPADLTKVTHREDLGSLPTVFEKLGEQNSRDRDIHSHAQSIRSADHLQQSALRQLLDQHTILWQESGMVNSQAVPKELLHLLTIRTFEIGIFQHLGNFRFLALGAEITTHQILRRPRTGQLREMDEVNRRPAGLHELLHFVLQRRRAVFEFQRHWPVLRLHQNCFRSGEVRDFPLKKLSLSQCRRH